MPSAEARQTEARHAAAWQRAAPYLGIACLALLAMSGAAATGLAAGGMAATGTPGPRAGRYTSALTPAWLAGPLAAPGLLASAPHLAMDTAGLAPTHALHTSQTLAAMTAASPALARRPLTALVPPIAGALATPALLVPIILARCH
jgi:hypothetical protein